MPVNSKKRILVAPLDWGLGHAARCVPIIRTLIDSGHEVIIATDKKPLEFLKAEFPGLLFICLPGFQVNYSRNRRMSMNMARQLPGMLKQVVKEHVLIQQLIEKQAIDLVISDNRYGLWSAKVPCVIISHQLTIQAPWGKWIINKLNTWFLKKFNQVWVPDLPGENGLSGELAINDRLDDNKIKYIGLLSRFSLAEKPEKNVYDFIAIISGPEPQRSIFEQLVTEQVKHLKKRGIIVQGFPDKKGKFMLNDDIEICGHLPGNKLGRKIMESKTVIARAGYTSIMELCSLGKKAILVPTPGQTEQEYLGKIHSAKGRFLITDQANLNLGKQLDEIESMELQPPIENSFNLADTILNSLD